MVAKRNIKAGEIIFKEESLEYGPNHSYDVLSCVACCRYSTDILRKHQVLVLFADILSSLKDVTTAISQFAAPFAQT